ncbi:unnamed protein product [Linum trigynum]|uniref:Uncharacterized protein n=1 Tax=Linum trigynum TaxID=586398 RepID=A0AAV2FD10_9ROSI
MIGEPLVLVPVSSGSVPIALPVVLVPIVLPVVLVPVETIRSGKKPAVARVSGGELDGDESLRDAPDEREDDEAEDGIERSGGLYGRLPTGDFEVDEEDERDQSQLLLHDRLRGGAYGKLLQLLL